MVEALLFEVFYFIKMKKELEHCNLNIKKWDLVVEKFDKGLQSKYFHFEQKRTVDSLPLKNGMCFLDIGCGTGWAVSYASSLLKGAGKFYGIDISPKMIEKAKENCRNFKNVYFYQANAEKLPFQDNFFDCIICTHSFHHYYNPSKALDEICRVLKFKGRIYIMDFSSDNFIMEWFDASARKRGDEHVRYYGTKEYIGLFKKSNIKYVNSGMLVFPFFPLKIHIGEKNKI